MTLGLWTLTPSREPVLNINKAQKLFLVVTNEGSLNSLCTAIPAVYVPLLLCPSALYDPNMLSGRGADTERHNV